MSTFVVSTVRGNDTTGTGSDVNPWKTFAKAQATIASGDEVLIEDGTYPEDVGAAGYCNLNRVFTSFVTFRSRSGVPSSVRLQGSGGSASLNIHTGAGNAAYYRFKDLTFYPALATHSATFRSSGGGPLEALNCVCMIPGDSSAVRYGYRFEMSSANVISDPRIEGGSVLPVVAHNNAWGIELNAAFSGASLLRPIIRGVTVRAGLPLSIVGATTGFEVDSVQLFGTAGYTVKVGIDGISAGQTTSGRIRASLIDGSLGTGHALMIGGGCSGVRVVDRCRVIGGDYGIVMKEHTGTIVEDSLVYGGPTATANTNGSAVYFKAANGCIVRRCGLMSTKGIHGVVRLGEGDTPGFNNSTNCQVTDSYLLANGAGQVIEWAGATEDDGGGVVNRNTYDARSGSTLGTIRGTGVATIAQAQAAWSGYTPAGNDSDSVMADYSDVAAPMRVTDQRFGRDSQGRLMVAYELIDDATGATYTAVREQDGPSDRRSVAYTPQLRRGRDNLQKRQ